MLTYILRVSLDKDQLNNKVSCAKIVILHLCALIYASIKISNEYVPHNNTIYDLGNIFLFIWQMAEPTICPSKLMN